jgi:hypothetical protein
MPTKFKQSQQTRDRQTGKYTTTHYWIKGISKEELIESLNKDSTKPKLKQKIRNELARRSIKIVTRTIDENLQTAS